MSGSTGPKILTWDIENSPALGYFYGSTYNTNIAKVVESSRVMSFAAKWYGDPAVEYRSIFHDGLDQMVARAWALLDEADAVISYNGKGHDTPHITTEFGRIGAGDPSPFKEIDLLQVVKRRMKFQQNRLDFVLQELGIGKKIQHEGIDLWIACINNDPKAWRRFKRYNINDVVQTEKLYDWLLPHIPRAMLPNHNLWTDDEVCPNCGKGGYLTRRGKTATLVAVYPRFYCTSCMTWSQGKKAINTVELRGVAR